MIYPLVLIIACTVFATINRNVPTGFKETRYVGEKKIPTYGLHFRAGPQSGGQPSNYLPEIFKNMLGTTCYNYFSPPPRKYQVIAALVSNAYLLFLELLLSYEECQYVSHIRFYLDMERKTLSRQLL